MTGWIGSRMRSTSSRRRSAGEAAARSASKRTRCSSSSRPLTAALLSPYLQSVCPNCQHSIRAATVTHHCACCKSARHPQALCRGDSASSSRRPPCTSSSSSNSFNCGFTLGVPAEREPHVSNQLWWAKCTAPLRIRLVSVLPRWAHCPEGCTRCSSSSTS